MLFLLALLILGMVWVASALIDHDTASMESLYDLWDFYLPYLYSCISLLGGLLLLMCTPILEDLDEQIYCIHLQEEALHRRLNGQRHLIGLEGQRHLIGLEGQRHLIGLEGQRHLIGLEGQRHLIGLEGQRHLIGPEGQREMLIGPEGQIEMLFGPEGQREMLIGPEGQKEMLIGPKGQKEMLIGPKGQKEMLIGPEGQREMLIGSEGIGRLVHKLPQDGTWYRNGSQPLLHKELSSVRTQRTQLVMLVLLTGTTISVLMVALNILYLLVDETAMPKGSTDREIGNTSSLSTFGVAQAALEILLMFYLLVSSVVGFYSLRGFKILTPRKDDTTMTTIIGCCVSILVLSSALPVMSRTLGQSHIPQAFTSMKYKHTKRYIQLASQLASQPTP
ncbi:hypothetical protein NHX12_021859 [Muraenolepis orangiensis]|uniref:Limb development membrane protein 1 n=1 Tax=Muraenolepis orangiensis TaxID=630683 RepID=A0A9Q0IWE2_9TELE|nr:hypothetical protein NHX12_021859 [Muraenolepis orangiensis]